MSKATKNYRLLTAKFYKTVTDDKGVSKNIAYVKNDIVPLTENEYAAFKDKFSAEVRAEASKAQVKVPGQAPTAKPAVQPAAQKPTVPVQPPAGAS